MDNLKLKPSLFSELEEEYFYDKKMNESKEVVYSQDVSVSLFINDKKAKNYVSFFNLIFNGLPDSTNKFYPFTCSCGTPSCDDFDHPIIVTKKDDIYEWKTKDFKTLTHFFKKNKIVFSEENYEKSLLNLLSFCIDNSKFVLSTHDSETLKEPFLFDYDGSFSLDTIEHLLNFNFSKRPDVKNSYRYFSLKYNNEKVFRFLEKIKSSNNI